MNIREQITISKTKDEVLKFINTYSEELVIIEEKLAGLYDDEFQKLITIEQNARVFFNSTFSNNLGTVFSYIKIDDLAILDSKKSDTNTYNLKLKIKNARIPETKKNLEILRRLVVLSDTIDGNNKNLLELRKSLNLTDKINFILESLIKLKNDYPDYSESYNIESLYFFLGLTTENNFECNDVLRYLKTEKLIENNIENSIQARISVHGQRYIENLQDKRKRAETLTFNEQAKLLFFISEKLNEVKTELKDELNENKELMLQCFQVADEFQEKFEKSVLKQQPKEKFLFKIRGLLLKYAFNKGCEYMGLKFKDKILPKFLEFIQSKGNDLPEHLIKLIVELPNK